MSLLICKPAIVAPLCVPALLLTGAGAQAAENSPTVDKSEFNLFNPTPPALMRELAPDRPDQTETPHTVDAGHFQLEMDFANFTYNHSQNETTRAWNVAPVNLKAGLLNNVDLQFILDDYFHVHTEDRAAGASDRSGFGDLTTRLKINLWGNDSGLTAFGLLPYLKFPVNTGHLGNDGLEGGIILPFAMKLPADFELGAETAAGVFRNQNNSDYHEEFIGSVTVDHEIIGKLSGYLELFGNATTERHSGWIGTVDLGLEYLVTENIQLDCGCNLGISPAADTVLAFSGITVRF